MRQTGSLLSAAALASLIFVAPLPEGYCQQNPDAAKIAQPGEAAGHKQSIAIPKRYPQAIAGLEVLADLTVTPAMYNGTCPVTLTTKAKITVNRATIVQLRFVRNDNTRSDLAVLVFDEPGTQEIVRTWQLASPTDSPDFSGWQAVQINYPMKVQSNTAYFRGTCTNAAQPLKEPSRPGSGARKE